LLAPDLPAGVVPCGLLGASPITDLSGHILNAGHFSQPATMAIGQSVMGRPFGAGVASSMRAS